MHAVHWTQFDDSMTARCKTCCISIQQHSTLKSSGCGQQVDHVITLFPSVFLQLQLKIRKINLRVSHTTQSVDNCQLSASLSRQNIFMLNPPTLKFNRAFNGSSI
jgi:hypothetical protein